WPQRINTTLVIKSHEGWEAGRDQLQGKTIRPAPILSAHRLKTPATWPPANPRESGHRSDGKPEVSGRCFEGETIA
ncbi:MAG TPA: hypothetical protein VIH63_04930, partial [Xanthobacteraceae bacterium]